MHIKRQKARTFSSTSKQYVPSSIVNHKQNLKQKDLTQIN